MTVWNICGVVLCALAATMVLKEIKKEWTIWIILCVMLIVLFFSTDLLKETLSFIRQLSEDCSDIATYTTVLIKGLGITYITYVAVEICKTAGEGTLANYAELAGKIELMLLGLPLFKDILSIAIGLVK